MGWVAAGIAGIGTGIGAALLGQQFGRLQLSNWSLLLAVLGAALLGVLVGLLVARPTSDGTSDDTGARAVARTPTPPAGGTGTPGRSATAEPTRAAAPGSADDPARPSAPETAEAAPPPPDAAPAGPYWCYVMGPVELLDLHEPTRVIAVLRPGTWYLAQRDAGEWVHVAADEGIEGWVPRSSVHRHG
jgi:hypothetical protein